MLLAEGTLIDDKFAVISSIGSGGMGVVYEAKQVGLDRVVALKLLSFVPSDSNEDVVRFEREALILSRLQHPNIVQFYAYGVWQNFPYIAMERLYGVSLQKKLAKSELLPIAQIIDYATQICDGLEHAHSHSIFHRDIKPSNIIISTTAEGKDIVKIIDFGLAKLMGSDVQKLTRTNTTVGSVMYMSPEQCVAKPIDARSDIYSLGCLLYHCFTGQPPYSADNAISVMFQQANQPVEQCQGWADLPEPVQSIISRCLAKDPALRYQSCSALRDDLAALTQMDLNMSALVRPARPNGVVAPAPAKPPTHSRNYLIPVLVLSAICLALTYYFATKDHTQADKATSSTAVESPKETLSRIVSHYERDRIDAESAKQLPEALRRCAQDATIDPNLVFEGYVRLASYYGYYRPGRDDRQYLSIARKALDYGALYGRKADQTGQVYGEILIHYHGICDRLGCELPLVNQLKQTLTKFPTMPSVTKNNLRFLLVRDYLRLGQTDEAKRMLDIITPETEAQRAEIATLRQACSLVAEIKQKRLDHQGAASLAIKLSELYTVLVNGEPLGGAPQAIGILQEELARSKENGEYDLLNLRFRIAKLYLDIGDDKTAEALLTALLKTFDDEARNPDRPRKDPWMYLESIRALCQCHLHVAHYAECAKLADHWAQVSDRAEIAKYRDLTDDVDLLRANAYRHLGRLSDAEKICKAIADRADPTLPGARTNRPNEPNEAMANSSLACVYYRQANYKAALTHAKIGVETQIKCSPLSYQLAIYRLILVQCLEKQNQITEASIQKNEALKKLSIPPDRTLRSLAYLCDDIVPLDSVTDRPHLLDRVSQ